MADALERFANGGAAGVGSDVVLYDAAGNPMRRDTLEDVTAAFKRGTAMDGGGGVSSGSAYKRNRWVYACVNLKARTVASVPFVIHRRDVEVDPRVDRVGRLFARPAPGKPRSDLWKATITALELTGNAIWFLDFGDAGPRPNTLPARIQWMNPRHITPRFSRDGSTLLFYDYTPPGTGKKVPIDPAEVIHFMYHDPDNPWWGMAPLTAAMQTVRLDAKQHRYGEVFYDNSAEPGGLLVHKGRGLAEPKKEQVRTETEDHHKGIERAHRMMILSGSWEYHRIGVGQREMEWIDQARYNREGINAVFGVPGILVNDTNKRNFATADKELEIFARHGWQPIIRDLEDVLDAQFFSAFAPDYSGKFDDANAPGVMIDIDARVARMERLVKIGVPLNQAKDLAGLEIQDQPWGDAWWHPAGLIAETGKPQPPSDEGDRGQRQLTVAGVSPPALPSPEPRQIAAPYELRNPEPMVRVSGGIIQDPNRDMYWRAFNARVTPLEGQFERRYSRHVNDLRGVVLRNLHTEGEPPKRGMEVRAVEDDWLDRVMFSLQDANVSMLQWGAPFVRDAMVMGGDMVLGELNLSSGYTIDSALGLDMFDRRQNLMVGPNETTFNRISASLREGLADGENIADLADRVRHQFNNVASTTRTVARTEIGTAVQLGRIDSMAKEGIERHEWLSSRDNVVRQDVPHNHMIDGEVVVLGDEFSNGLRWPLDDAGSGSEPGNTINCRCVTLTVIE